MTERRSLDLKLVLSVLAAFLLSMAFTWFLHTRLSERDAYALIDRTFTAVEAEIIDCVDERLVRLCLAVRERLDEKRIQGYTYLGDSLVQYNIGMNLLVKDRVSY